VPSCVGGTRQCSTLPAQCLKDHEGCGHLPCSRERPSCLILTFMHKISVLGCLNLVESKLVGLYTLDSVTAYEEALKAQFTSGRLCAGYRMLLDLSEAAVQKQEIIDALVTHVAEMPKASRIGVVTGAVAIKLQARRVLKGSHIKHFDERAAALSWLMSEDATRCI
jgi:hypothetical protein